MPRTAPLRCRNGRCSNTVDVPGLCEKCGGSATRKRRDRERWHDYHGDWPAIRERKVTASPMCECEGCDDRCCHGQARTVEVDHVVELRDVYEGRVPEPTGGVHGWENLRSLCSHCHKVKSLRMRRERAARGGGSTVGR